MKEFFVIGNQTSSSLSPLIFNHWFKKYKIKAKYSYVEVDDIGFDTAIAKKLENKNTNTSKHACSLLPHQNSHISNV